MYPTSDRWAPALRSSSQRLATRLDVVTPSGELLASGLPVKDGGVQVNASAGVRRVGDFTLTWSADLVPSDAHDLLSPLSGNELRPYRGLTYPDGSSELVPLGVLPVRGCRASGDSIVVNASDRSTTVTRARWTTSYTTPAGALEDAIAAILSSRAPMLPYDFQATGATVPARTFGVDSTDPWADAQQLATDAGYDLFFDADGVAVLRPPTDPATAAPIADYADDSAAVVSDPEKVWDSSTSYNGVVALGESSDPYVPAATATVWDDDPVSATYYLGKYGAYPEFISSPNWGADSDAEVAARAQLARRRGVAQTITWSQLVDPALDAGDAVRFTNARLEVSGMTVVLDSLAIPWTAGGLAQTATRTVQVSG